MRDKTRRNPIYPSYRLLKAYIFHILTHFLKNQTLLIVLFFHWSWFFYVMASLIFRLFVNILNVICLYLGQSVWPWTTMWPWYAMGVYNDMGYKRQIKHWLWFLEFLFCFKIYFCMGAHLSKPWIYLYNVQVMAILKLCLPIFATIFKSWTFGICSRVWKNLAFREKIENVEDGCKYYSALAESIWAIPQDFAFTAYKF